MPGLVSRLGAWLDTKWEEKVTVSQLKEVTKNISEALNIFTETAVTDRKKAEKFTIDTRLALQQDIQSAHSKLSELFLTIEKVKTDLAAIPQDKVAEIENIKARIDKIEVYNGMKRIVDPAKGTAKEKQFYEM